MFYFYAQIDGANKVTAVSQLGAPIVAAHMISIPAYDESLLGKPYNPGDGTFSA